MSRPLRIAVVANRFPVVSETFILRQISGLIDKGHDVRIFADARPESSAPVHPEVQRLNLLDRTTYVHGPAESVIWELPAKPLGGVTWVPGAERSSPNWRRWLAAAPIIASCAIRCPKLLRDCLNPRVFGFQAQSLSSLYRLATLGGAKGGFDVVHAHFGPVGNSYRFARSLWRCPLVVSFHGYDFSTEPRKHGRNMYQALFQTADLITVNSDYTRKAVAGLGTDVERLKRLPVGLDLREFAFRLRSLLPGEAPRLITVARLTEIKGHEFALRALAKLKSALPGLRYDVVGDGPLRSKLEALARELGLGDRVVFHGAQAAPKLKDLLDKAHLFMLTSVSIEGDQEGQGLALQEAQACGLSVIATSHGALPEGLLEGRSGFLVPERDPEALAARLQWLCDNASLWPALGKTGREFVEQRYDIHKLNDQLISIYDEAIQRYRTAQPA